MKDYLKGINRNLTERERAMSRRVFLTEFFERLDTENEIPDMLLIAYKFALKNGLISEDKIKSNSVQAAALNKTMENGRVNDFAWQMQKHSAMESLRGLKVNIFNYTDKDLMK